MAQLPHMVIALRSALVACTFLAYSTGVLACEMPAPFAIEAIRSADAVFAGRLIDYRRVEFAKPATLGTHGVLTFKVDAVIEGSVPDTVEIAWFNSTYEIPEDWGTDVALLVAARRHKSDLPEPEWRVLQTICGPAFMLDDTPQSRANVRKALRGESVPPHDYFALQTAEFRRQRAEASRKDATAEQAEAETIFGIAVLGGIAAVLAAIALAAWLATRRNR